MTVVLQGAARRLGAKRSSTRSGSTRDPKSAHMQPWGLHEDNLIRDQYPTRGGVDLFRAGALPGRTLVAIRRRAEVLGVRIRNMTDMWSDAELEVLVEWYAAIGPTRIRERYLPERAFKAICSKAEHMGLRYRPPFERTLPSEWADHERRLLAGLYPFMGARHLAKSGWLPGRTTRGIQIAASRAGVRRLCRPAWTREDVQSAAGAEGNGQLAELLRLANRVATRRERRAD